MSPFVKLDCGTINSTLWLDRDARDVFLTALLLAIPDELSEPIPEIQTDTLDPTGWFVPSGAYGLVHASGPGIIAAARLDLVPGMAALKRLSQPEPNSRSRAFDGRRLVRIDGCYVVLNYMAYRDKDYTNAARQRRFRENRRNAITPLRNGRALPVTEADAYAEETKTNTGAAKPRRIPSQHGHPSWLAPFGSAFHAKSGTPNWGELAKVMKPICDDLGASDALKAFTDFLDGKDARFGVGYFSKHWQDYRPTPLTLENGDLNPEAILRAQRRGINL